MENVYRLDPLINYGCLKPAKEERVGMFYSRAVSFSSGCAAVVVREESSVLSPLNESFNRAASVFFGGRSYV